MGNTKRENENYNENHNEKVVCVNAERNAPLDVAEVNKIAGMLEALSWTAPDPYGEMLVDLASRLSKAVRGETLCAYV